MADDTLAIGPDLTGHLAGVCKKKRKETVYLKREGVAERDRECDVGGLAASFLVFFTA